MTEISESRAMREIWRARKNPAAFTTEQEARINKVYESKTRNKDYVMRLRINGGVYTFSVCGKKNRYLFCPETKFEFFPNGYCVMTKDNAQGTDRTAKYYQY